LSQVSAAAFLYVLRQTRPASSLHCEAHAQAADGAVGAVAQVRVEEAQVVGLVRVEAVVLGEALAQAADGAVGAVPQVSVDKVQVVGLVRVEAVVLGEAHALAADGAVGAVEQVGVEDVQVVGLVHVAAVQAVRGREREAKSASNAGRAVAGTRLELPLLP